MIFGEGVATSETEGGIKYYDSQPDGKSGQITVLLHGTGGTAYSSFKSLLPMMATRQRVITFDFTDEENGNDSLAPYVSQAMAVIQHAAPGKPVNILGYSFGAVVAAVLAAQHPKSLRALILVAGWMRTDEQQVLRNEIWESLSRSQHEAFGSFMTLTGYSDRFLRARTRAEILELNRQAASGPDRSHKMRINREVDISALTSRIAAPTLVIGCRDDIMVPVHHSRLLFGAIQDSRFAEIAAGHSVVIERPAELLSLSDNFFAEPQAHPAGAVIPPTRA